MSDDDDDDRPVRRKSRKAPKKSGDQSLKILLIVIGSLGGLTVISCCGAGVWMYFSVKSTLENVTKNAHITEPAAISQVVNEMTDITIPPEFVPKSASKFMSMNAEYEWCPTGTCVPAEHGFGTLRIESDVPGSPQAADDYSPFTSMFNDGVLQLGWKEFQREEHVLDIRGKKCKFYIVTGEMWIDDVLGGDDDELAPPGGAAPVDPATRQSVKAVHFAGDFPGKVGKVELECRLAPEQYDETKILTMLRSIR